MTEQDRSLTKSSTHSSPQQSIHSQLLHDPPAATTPGSQAGWVTHQRMISRQMLKQLALWMIGGMSEHACCSRGLWLDAKDAYFLYHVSG